MMNHYVNTLKLIYFRIFNKQVLNSSLIKVLKSTMKKNE